MAVASVDNIKNSSTVASINVIRYIDGLGQLVVDHIRDGFEPYMASFMFKLGSFECRSRDQQMREEISRVYSRFLTECVRNPHSRHNRRGKPILIGCQDWPVWKRHKEDRLIALPWEGVHWGAILLVPPRSRLKVGVKDHFETVKRNAYVLPGQPLSRIHIEHVSYRPEYATEYVFKSLKRGRCSIDDILILPLSESERPDY